MTRQRKYFVDNYVQQAQLAGDGTYPWDEKFHLMN